MAPQEHTSASGSLPSSAPLVTIRSYTAADHTTVRALFIDGMVTTYCPGATNQGLRNYVERSLQGDMADIDGTYFGSGGHFWVATLVDADGTEVVVGTIAIEGKDDDRGELRRLSVRSDYRRRGIAQQLIAHLETWATTHGFAYVFLTTGSEMVPAIQLYTARGYTIYKEAPAPSNPQKILLSFEKKLTHE